MKSRRLAHSARWFCAMSLAALAAALAAPLPASAQVCAGDCDENGTVGRDEQAQGVRVALGDAELDTCSFADVDMDEKVTVDDLVAASVDANGACAAAGTPTPVATAAATPTVAVPDGVFWHPNSTLQHVLFPEGNFTSINLMLVVDKQPEATAVVTLGGPGGASAVIPAAAGTVFLDGREYASYYLGDSTFPVPYVAGASYTLTAQTSAGTATATFVAPGGIGIAADGSQASWTHEGDAEQIVVVSPAAYDSGIADRTSPFAIPAEAYGAGNVQYRVGTIVARTVADVAGAAIGSSLLVTDGFYALVNPVAVGPTFTASPTRTSTATRTATPTATPSPTITGTIPPTPALVGQILFTSTRNGGTHVFVMDPDGANAVQLTTGAGFHGDPEWNADKSLIAFTRDTRLHLMNADGSDVRALRPSGSQFEPTFSPDGARIVFAELAADFSRTDLYAYEIDGGAITRLTFETMHHAASPTFSPDGQFIFFTSTRDSRFFEIYRMNADGSNVVRVTDNSDYEQLGEVSPDGTRLVYSARAAFGTVSLGVWVAGADGSNPRLLTSTADDSDDEHALWSPDGAYIAYRPHVSDRNRVFRMQANGLFAVDLSPAGASEVVGDWK